MTEQTKNKSINERLIKQGILERIIAYKFSDPTLLATALTHKSASSQAEFFCHGQNNERLEFLGDAVLSLVCAEYLYKLESHLSEGMLSRLRAQFVCQSNLSDAAKKINLSDFIISDKAMRTSGSTNFPSILSDALESIIGAVYLDGGLEASKQVIFKVLGTPSSDIGVVEKDSKTKLQEIIQANHHTAPKYQVIESMGPDHAPTFVVGVELNGELIATGSGENKKLAAQSAASGALKKLATNAAHGAS